MKTLICFFLLATLPLTAQESLIETRKYAFANPLDPANQDAINILNRMDKTEEYSLMLFDHWLPMDAEGKDGLHLHIDSANYHIGQDKIFFINQSKLFELYPDKIDQVVINHHTFMHTQYEYAERQVKSRFFEVLEDGEYALLCKYEIKKETTNDHPMGISAATKIDYRRDEKYYYLREGARLPELIPTNKKDFILIFRKNRPQMVIFAKENRLSLRDPEDLKALFAYYNMLASQS